MDKLLERFCRYVRVETTAVEQTDAYPSSAGQLELGKMLVNELKELGAKDVSVSEHGIVMATIPGTVDGAPTIAWLAHMDTSPEASGKGVKPIVHKDYDGGDIVLPGDSTKVLRADQTPELVALAGKTIITSDGTTLLGADDKAGIAVIMTTLAHLQSRTEIPRGPIRIVFTCDEEVGRGADHVDLKTVNAVVGYTLDGEGAGSLENETFSADVAIVTVQGINIHPGLATGRMVNAIRVAGLFLSRLPWERLAPETTADREGFLHPYVMEGGVDSVKLRILLRSFETGELARHAQVLRDVSASILAEHPRAKIDIDIKTQYRNMAEALKREPRAVALADEAIRRAGGVPRLESIRGGTDGSRLSEMGLPTPNLSTGMHNFHSPLEFACLEEMEAAVKVLAELAQLWSKET